MIKQQILETNLLENVYQLKRRINSQILGVRGLLFTSIKVAGGGCLPCCLNVLQVKYPLQATDCNVNS